MATKVSTTVTGAIVGVFDDPIKARQAVTDLRAAGYTESQIGVLSHDRAGDHKTSNTIGNESLAEEGGMATAGAAVGAGAGALWGLGILAGVLPGIGPAIAGGTLGVLLSSAAAGAAIAGVGAALASIGVVDEDAEYYEKEFNAGKTIVTVHGVGDTEQAKRILYQHGASNRSESWFD